MCRSLQRVLLSILAALWLAASMPLSACPLFANAFELAPLAPADPLCALADEFENPATLSQWQRIHQVEGWPHDQLQIWDIGQSAPGRMTLVPYTSSWFQDLRGVLVFKPVTGDFVVETRFTATNRAGSGAPGALYSLAGLFVRSPRPITSPAQWTPGGENYVFLSAGAADAPSTWQHEVKTTRNSDSVLEITSACPAACPAVPVFELRVARLDGVHIILLRRPQGGQWLVHRRYRRDDFPATLQVGLTSYTDWGTILGTWWPSNQFGHNMTLITQGNPDLRAQFDHVRFRTPSIPNSLQGRDFSAAYNPANPATVSDAALLSFLAD